MDGSWNKAGDVGAGVDPLAMDETAGERLLDLGEFVRMVKRLEGFPLRRGDGPTVHVRILDAVTRVAEGYRVERTLHRGIDEDKPIEKVGHEGAIAQYDFHDHSCSLQDLTRVIISRFGGAVTKDEGRIALKGDARCVAPPWRGAGA